MPDNFGRMTSDEAPQSLKDFCFPKQEQKEESIYKHTPYDALWAIANMQITENTDKGEALALCMSIARIEIHSVEDLYLS